MPELPEVETIRRVLTPQITGQRIVRVTAVNPQVIAHPQADQFCGRIEGQVICGTQRRGKYMMMLLDGGGRMVLHLRMTGGLLVTPPAYPLKKHTHLIFELENGNELRFADSRRFGRFWLFDKEEEDTCSGMQKLGLEPLDARLTADYLRAALGGRKKTIKECLLEQGVVCGIGNIYADEILFTARISPKRPACSLKPAEWRRLAETIPQQIAYFIEKNEISPEDYFVTQGKEYRNTPFLRVYGHGGKPCPVCKKTLQKQVIGGRGSVSCPKCQK